MRQTLTRLLKSIGLALSACVCLYIFPKLFVLVVVTSLVIIADRQLQRWNRPHNLSEPYEIVGENTYTRLSFAWQPNYRISSGSILFHEPFSQIRGSFYLPAFDSRHEFTYTTDSQGRRATSRTPEDLRKPVIAVFGCSLTWGTGVSDEHTYCWKLQERFPDYRVINYGVAGFSPYEVHLLLADVLRHERPAIVVHAHLGKADTRSLGRYPEVSWYRGPRCASLKMPWRNRRTLFRLPEHPIARCINWISVPALKAILHWILALPWIPTNRQDIAKETSRHLFLLNKGMCERLGIPYVVVALQSARRHGEFLSEHRIPWCAFGPDEVDYEFKRTYSLFPFDEHYNENAHAAVCETLTDSLRRILRGEIVQGCPPPGPRLSAANLDYIYPMF